MILSVSEFGVEGDTMTRVGTYHVAEGPTLESLEAPLQSYLGGVASEDYHARVTRWFDSCVGSRVITELNLGNGKHYIDRWEVVPD